MVQTKKFDGKVYTLRKTVYGRADARDAVANFTRKGFYVRVTELSPKSSQGYVFRIWTRKSKKGERNPSTKTRKFSGRFL